MISALLLLLQAGAQNRISGRVTDEENLPLIGANIYLPELNKGTITNRQGEYSISELPAKKLKVQFSFVGFNNSIETVNLSDGDTILDITLSGEIIQSQEVVVSGAYIGSQHENAIKIF